MEDIAGKDDGFQPVRRRVSFRKRVNRDGNTPYGTEVSSTGLGEGAGGNDDAILVSVDVEQIATDVVMGVDLRQEDQAPTGGTGEQQQKAGQPGSFDFKPLVFSVERKKGPNAQSDVRRVVVPPHRLSPLKTNWTEIVTPIVGHLKLQIRMNTKRRCVEIRDSPNTSDSSALQKATEFIRAYMLGFDVSDAIALLRLDDLFTESFEVKDVKRLNGEHLSRCIGRLSGKDGKTKYAIENATRTRIVLADSRIHILGSFQNIKLARNAICSLILGSPPGKVYNSLRTVAKRVQERL